MSYNFVVIIMYLLESRMVTRYSKLETHNNSDHPITYDSDSDYLKAQGELLRCVLHSLELPHPEVFYPCFFLKNSYP